MSDTNVLTKNKPKIDKTKETTVTSQRVYDKANISAFKVEIKNISWSEVLNETNNSEKVFNTFIY